MGQRADSASIAAVRQDLGLDKPVVTQYFKYLNDLSPLSLHENSNSKSYFYLDNKIYSPFATILKVGHKSLVLKYTYLRRSYQSKKEVSAIIKETLPNTMILAVAAIVFASLLGIFLGIISALYKDTW